MKEEGLLYDVETGGFLHVHYDRKLIIDKKPCGHKHSVTTVVSAE